MKTAWAVKLQNSYHSVPLPIASRWLHNAAPTTPHISSLPLRRLLRGCPTGSSLLFPFGSVRTFSHRVRGEESCLVQGENTDDNKMNLSRGKHTVCQIEQTCPCSNWTEVFTDSQRNHFHPCCFSAVSVLCQMWRVLEGFQKMNLKSVSSKMNRCKTYVCVCVSECVKQTDESQCL